MMAGVVNRPRVPPTRTTRGTHGKRRDDGERAAAKRRIEQRANSRGDDEDEADPGRHERRDQQSRGRDRRPPPSLLEGDEAPDAERDGPDEARLEHPEDVLRPLPRSSSGIAKSVAATSSDASSDEDVRAGNRDHVEDDHLGEIGQVRVEANDVKRKVARYKSSGNVDQCSLTGRRKSDQHSVERDRAPLVVPEREGAAEVENRMQRRAQPRRRTADRATRLRVPSGDEARHDGSLFIRKAGKRARVESSASPPGGPRCSVRQRHPPV